jgi:hypothetical protein
LERASTTTWAPQEHRIETWAAVFPFLSILLQAVPGPESRGSFKVLYTLSGREAGKEDRPGFNPGSGDPTAPGGDSGGAAPA